MAMSADKRPGDRERLIDQLCGRFEDGWRSGRAPAIEEFIRQGPLSARPDLFRRVLEIELEYRRNTGRPLGPDEARDRFAGIGPWAAAIVDELVPAEPSLILDVIHGPYAGSSFPLIGHATFTIGRQPGQHICLSDDLHLSRTHCLVEVNPPLVRVVDLGSKHGTLVNGRKAPQADLRDGDEVTAGQTVFRVRVPVGGGIGTQSFSNQRSASDIHAAGPPAVPGYRIVRELGNGAMGVVHLAVHEKYGRQVAIKSLLPAIPPTRTILGRFVRESAILRELNHPKIVAFSEAGSSGPLLYFIMEYVPGVSAEVILKQQGPLPPARLLAWAGQFLDALAYAHGEGYVHRDVKPSNLLVVGPVGSEVVKLSDFGLARAYEESSMSGLTLANAFAGTPGFMPPEQVLHFRTVQPAADQYAAAATLFQLLTGRRLYEHFTSQQELLARILNEDPLPLRPDAPPLPEPFGAVIRRALSRDPKQRFSDMRAMMAALFRK